MEKYEQHNLHITLDCITLLTTWTWRNVGKRPNAKERTKSIITKIETTVTATPDMEFMSVKLNRQNESAKLG